MIEVKLAYLPSVLPGRHERELQGAVVASVCGRDGCWRVALGSRDLLGQGGPSGAGPQPPLHLPTRAGPWAGVGAGHFSLEQAGDWAVGCAMAPRTQTHSPPPSLARLFPWASLAPVGNTRGLSLGLRPRSILSRVLSVDAEASCPLPRSRVQVSSHVGKFLPHSEPQFPHL